MAFRFFHIPSRGCASSESELNSFLASHRVLSVDRRWVDLGENSYWAICVDYLPSSSASTDGHRAAGRNRIDYREVLSPEEFQKFARLRELRKEMAAEEGVPVYTILTNEQLAQIVQKRVRSRADFKAIDGIGVARIEKYGDRILKIVNDQIKTDATPSDETNRESV